ncbi:ATP-binding protein [Cupriavidus sp. AcVe19-1a]|uniref:ATP-binding protein n=1 Tax=Cupriavidus sp. AcVe19-1a TaxID=2821359 RepID=UPI001AE90689|nr:ATP-binding protein [Cupriavidus sp. AcVe19-1a]MBP0633073.1 ATP-binding protein [Cupriavidus sp. AcVe19-1a]
MSGVPTPIPDAEHLARRIAQRRADRNKVRDRRREWQECAAVLAWFRPDMIGAPSRGEDRLSDEDWMLFLGDTEPVPLVGGARRLGEAVRRDVLTRLGTDGWRKARARVRAAPDSALQRTLDAALAGKTFDPNELGTEELDALHTVSRWLNGLAGNIPPLATVTVWGLRFDLLAPLRRITSSFVGREAELDTIRAYLGDELAGSAFSQAVGHLRNFVKDVRGQKTLVLWGPGGVGKSTLVARVLTQYSDRDLPFVYIDLDRPSIDPRDSFALIAQAQRQLVIQRPEAASVAAQLTSDLEEASLERITTEASRATHSLGGAIERFSRLVENVAKADIPVPFVIDTFEEAQALGDQALPGIASLVRTLRTVSSGQIRPLICGRVPPDDDLFDSRAVPIRAFEAEQAAEFLQKYLERKHRQSHELRTLRPIVATVSRTPLALSLAAQVIAEHGLDAVPRPGLLARLLHVTDEADLYSRVLGHLHDPQLRALAKPGLLVRRLTPAVVIQVLAEPCGLSLANEAEAEDLLSRFAISVSLVEKEPDGALRHRQDVRRQMLPSLEREVGAAVAEEINRRAVVFYSRPDAVDAISLAEHMYHLLRLGEVGAAASLWAQETTETAAALDRLRSAVEELRPDAHRALKLKLGMRLTSEERSAADQDEWEQAAFGAASAYLADGAFDRAVSILGERSERLPDSRLSLLEVEAFSGLRQWERALTIAIEGIERARARRDSRYVLTLSLAAARACEALGDSERTLELLSEAQTEANLLGDVESSLRIAAARARSAGQMPFAESESDVAEAIRKLKHSGALERLNGAALREVAAELGHVDRSLIRAALFRLGIPELDTEHLEQLAVILAENSRRNDELARLIVVTCAQFSANEVPPDPANSAAWSQWAAGMPRQKLAYALADLIGANDEIAPSLVHWTQSMLQKHVQQQIHATYSA